MVAFPLLELASQLCPTDPLVDKLGDCLLFVGYHRRLTATTLVGIEEQGHAIVDSGLVDLRVRVYRRASLGEAQRPFGKFRVMDARLAERVSHQMLDLVVNVDVAQSLG